MDSDEDLIDTMQFLFPEDYQKGETVEGVLVGDLTAADVLRRLGLPMRVKWLEETPRCRQA